MFPRSSHGSTSQFGGGASASAVLARRTAHGQPQVASDHVAGLEAAVTVQRPRDRLLAEPARQLDAAVVGDRRVVDGDAGVVAGRGQHVVDRDRGPQALGAGVRRCGRPARRRSRAAPTPTSARRRAPRPRRSRRESSPVVSAAVAHDDAPHRPVAQHVGLAAQPAAVDARCRTARPTSAGTTPSASAAAGRRRGGT